MLKIKVCGMRTTENISEISKLPIQYIGFIFYPKSSRYVYKVPETLCSSKTNIKKTGVFVNARLNEIHQKIEQFNLQALQLHGQETPKFCKTLQQAYPKLEIIKVFAIGNNSFNFEQLEDYQKVVNYFLFDTKGQHPGGNGVTFNWNLLCNYHLNTPFFLSGGISHNSIEKLLTFEHPQLYGIDINSKFEIAPALKDAHKIKKFIHSLTTSAT